MESVAAPPQVRNAVALLWASLILTNADMLASGLPSEDFFDWVMWLVFAAIIGLNAYLIFLVSRRKNWARISLLILTVLITGAVLFWPPETGSDPWWSVLLICLSTVADVVAMIWLFSGSGDAWFRRVATPRPPVGKE